MAQYSLREKYPNTEFFLSVFSCIQSEYRTMKRTRENSVLGHFSRNNPDQQDNYIC